MALAACAGSHGGWKDFGGFRSRPCNVCTLGCGSSWAVGAAVESFVKKGVYTSRSSQCGSMSTRRQSGPLLYRDVLEVVLPILRKDAVHLFGCMPTVRLEQNSFLQSAAVTALVPGRE